MLENQQSVNLHIDDEHGLRIYHPNMDIFESERGAINIDAGPRGP